MMATGEQAILFYVHDPMCSWCWGYSRTWDKLLSALPASVTPVTVVGGLAPDTDDPMPAAQQETIAGYWHQVAEQTGAEFNFDFWTRCKPRRSTYPACRAVLAAASQGSEAAMIDAIQRAYYLRAMNPSDTLTLVQLAEELGLDVDTFSSDLASPEIQQALERNLALRREIGVYSFPSLVLKVAGSLQAIEVDYRSHQTSLAEIRAILDMRAQISES